ncbi:DNA adenine methylase [Roseinatronobacter sp. NSM]|uniref:DNA adenine methylase n=1 Tax=Roseinatronobacter sp. NSM TaxID=3457785 RepID=UPI004035C42F
MTPISQTARPIAPWIGGKRNLAKRICAIIDADQAHKTYAEPFVGMGGVFLRRTSRPRAEFINDRSRDVYNLFRVLQEHYVAFLDLLRFQITTQANFERLVQVDPVTLTDMQRAARFLFLQRAAFGGKVSGRTFGLSRDRPARFNLTTLEPDLEALHSRLSGVCVTCLDFTDFIRRIDHKETLFYLDPPYWGCEGYYGRALFSRERFEDMATQLGTLKGRFIMSLNDTPGVREVFRGFEIKEISTVYTAASSGPKAAAEVLIMNFKPG